MQYWDIVVGHRLVVDPLGKHGNPWSGRMVIVLKDCGYHACPSIIPPEVPAFWCCLVDDPTKKAYLAPYELEPEVPTAFGASAFPGEEPQGL